MSKVRSPKDADNQSTTEPSSAAVAPAASNASSADAAAIAQETFRQLLAGAAEPPKTDELTTAQTWRRMSSGVALVRLPSGNVVKARRINAARAVREGQLQPTDIPGATQDEAVAEAGARRIVILGAVYPKFVAEDEVHSDEQVSVEALASFDTLLLAAWIVNQGAGAQLGHTWVDD